MTTWVYAQKAPQKRRISFVVKISGNNLDVDHHSDGSFHHDHMTLSIQKSYFADYDLITDMAVQFQTSQNLVLIYSMSTYKTSTFAS